jgi:hypothetical protein
VVTDFQNLALRRTLRLQSVAFTFLFLLSCIAIAFVQGDTANEVVVDVVLLINAGWWAVVATGAKMTSDQLDGAILDERRN